MLKGRRTLQREIVSAQSVFLQFGIVPLAFRPPVGITNPLLWRVLLENSMFCVNFSRRAADFGNRRVKELAHKILSKVAPNDIILLHDVAPRRGDVTQLLQEFATLIEGVKGKGLEILPLAQLIGKDVMHRGPAGSGPNQAEQFYNGLAATYDTEQFATAVSLSRSTELQLYSSRRPVLFAGSGRALEIGAGTGIFTLDIARHCSEVVAVDISGNMLKLLEKKADEEGVKNIRIQKGNVETMALDGLFSVACAFSALEYLVDLPAFITRLAHHIEPGGTVYFITARSSLLRLVTQVGNAMRQGLWLKAHSRREIEAMLAAAGFEQIAISSHLLKSWLSGGMLLEVAAHKPVAATASGGE
jgi:2-polyprenyl-3-methyl-5-hydroxy-6-metoxy-1,4-benzoquinol methylase